LTPETGESAGSHSSRPRLHNGLLAIVMDQI
jgi:hypothetical protein